MGAKAGAGNAVTNDSHRDALGQEIKFLRGEARRTLGGAYPSHGDIEIREFWKLGRDGYADFFLRQAHERINAVGGETSDGSEGAKSPVGENKITRIEEAPKLPEELRFVGLAVAVGSLQQSPGVQTKNADEVHDREAATGLLALALGPAGLIGLRIGHGNTGAIDYPDMTAVPAAVEGSAGLQAIDKMLVNLGEHRKGNFGACLAIRAGIRTEGKVLFPRKLSASEGHDFANGFTAGALRRLDLIKEGPEDDLQRINALAAVVSCRLLIKQSLWNIRAEELAKLTESAACGDFGEGLR